MGNGVAADDLESGRLYNAIEFNGWRKLRSLTHHPDSHEKVDGIIIENWSDICRKVEEFQKALPFVKAAGWDIALTHDGPYIVEVNDMWDRTGQLFIGRGWKKEIEECYEAWMSYYGKH